MITLPYNELIDIEKQILEATTEEFQEEINNFKTLYNEFINLIKNLILILNDEKHYSKKKLTSDVIILTLTLRIINLAKLILDLNGKGYYSEAKIFYRSFLEDWEHLIVFVDNPKKISSFLRGNVDRNEVLRKLDNSMKWFDNECKNVGVRGALGPVWKKCSKFVHTSRDSLDSFFEEKDMAYTIYITPRYEPKEYWNTFYHVYTFLGSIFMFNLKFFNNYIEKTEHYEDIHKTIQRLSNKYGLNVDQIETNSHHEIK